ncbi:hypothetical protein Lser_V15G03255 [Lactuca serriola]
MEGICDRQIPFSSTSADIVKMEGLSERQTQSPLTSVDIVKMEGFMLSSSASADIVIPQPTSTSISQIQLKMEISSQRETPWSFSSASVGKKIIKSARWEYHENIIPFIVCGYQKNEWIMVSTYADNYSLQDHLQDPKKKRSLKWPQRLRICLGAARGLSHLHSGLGKGRVLVHRNFKSSNVLLDENLKPKVCGLCLSRLLDRNQPQVCKPLSGIRYYLDPIYEESCILTMESDIYSFGVVMFEMLTGMLADNEKSIGEDPPQTLINLVQCHYGDGMDKLIDPDIKDEINDGSLHTFMDIAYDCISLRLQCRPTMNKIVERIEGALDRINKRIMGTPCHEPTAESEGHHSPGSTVAIRSQKYQNPESFLIPLEEIKLATRNFSENTRFRSYGSAAVYKGRLSERWKNREACFKCRQHWQSNGANYEGTHNDSQVEHRFRNEVEMMPNFANENIIPFIGYCDEVNEMIIVTEYAINGSVDQHLPYYNERGCLTWAQRLKICIGAARGLEYLHSGLGEGRVVIHRNFKSSKILLDDNWEAKICGFGFSTLLDRHLQPQVHEHLPDVDDYLDPISEGNGILTMESDIYSFGVVMFEILSGMLASRTQGLINLVRRNYRDGVLDKLIDHNIRYETNLHSLHAFEKLAYRCISLNIKERPTLSMIIKRLQDIQNNGSASTITTKGLESYFIPLMEIKLATRDFSPETQIGYGGFGMVYKGQLSERWGNHTVAIKRRDPQGKQGKKEFQTELELISTIHHPNIIPFIGYCDEGNEMIIVNKYANNHSLDYHLEDLTRRYWLTWEERLNICLGAAKGLDHLHSGLGKNNMVIHRDVKSGNILLDENMETKICDFGLSKQSPRNKQYSQLFTKAAGTYYYVDPAYKESGILRKESDVYSFGVVLFEILSGMLAYHQMSFGDGDPQSLIELVRRYYNNEPKKLIDPIIIDQIGSCSIDTFSKLAYDCISLNSAQRPTMDAIIDGIEDAIGFQDYEEWRRDQKASHADSPFNLKKALHELEKKKLCWSSDYVEFYSYAFRYCLTEEKQRSINIESICELLELVLGSQFSGQVNLFIRYLKTQNHYKAINMDQWMGFYRFCKEISSSDFNNYDKEHAWPLILDNFVDWVRSNKARLQRNALRQTE